MIKSVIHDQQILSQTSIPATKQDLSVVMDLMDTLKANSERCVGMAANMIGVHKRIIVVTMGMMNVPMINPVILKKGNPYTTEEGCLSLTGERSTTRYDEIEVQYLDLEFKKHTQEFKEFIAQIIQHEVDHCDGIII
ncbi:MULTISPECIES: peptide deformylase [Pediococcus]|uniref:N-formylmethionyl-tRNA deformylase n=1 Tax=Pediococcus pentosaceus (strain ATCC 25745 / CCUG 21536 / LMG 10740 / 183-1w) TaxID=278197 RepID=Q03DM5_PEDPA|nr:MULTISPECIES: peptide deformylase [Pediococcus]ABJ68697.1 N-formylmethionyl-tRNA deformylase [Pediococcus pentosaceus ATCC 25745]AVL02113.1 peptide deformylase [Pediococcus pentosaceus]KAF5440144.1 peptide deformylase [Pediococcus sp. EKM202D]KAF5440411.1 peptide deformylase [Pediococcus sp. EKM201D]MBF7134358.1 peptide deformylase [Pediococcus pentosaceus]